MRVLVIGATGACGILLIRESLARGHTVVRYARTPSKLPPELVEHEKVTVIQGGLEDQEKLKEALKDVDAVLSALGPRVTNGPFHPSDTPIARGIGVVLQAMKEASCTRMIALGTTSIKVRPPRDYPFEEMTCRSLAG
jgi:putative NADH-flavin reductase